MDEAHFMAMVMETWRLMCMLFLETTADEQSEEWHGWKGPSVGP